MMTCFLSDLWFFFGFVFLKAVNGINIIKKTTFIQMPPDEWHSIIIILNRKQKSALFMIGNHEIEIKMITSLKRVHQF